MPIAVEAKKMDLKESSPKDSVNEASIVDGIDVFGIENLKDVVSFLNNELELQSVKTNLK